MSCQLLSKIRNLWGLAKCFFEVDKKNSSHFKHRDGTFGIGLSVFCMCKGINPINKPVKSFIRAYILGVKMAPKDRNSNILKTIKEEKNGSDKDIRKQMTVLRRNMHN